MCLLAHFNSRSCRYADPGCTNRSRSTHKRRKKGENKMRKTVRYFTLLLAPALLAWTVLAALPAVAQSATNGATAELKDAQGQTIGNATLTTAGSGAVKIQVSV